MSRTTARRLVNSILASEWAIRPEWLEQFASIASQLGEDGRGAITAEEIRGEIKRALATLTEGRGPFHALSADYGEPLGVETRATVRDGVAIVPVIGPLYHYADELHDVCGCSSYAQIATDIAAIRAAGPRVRSVILEVDSPGGEVGGCAETAAMIAQLATEVPVVAYVSDLGASAAYWLSASAGRVVVAPTAIVGSIGVVAAFRRKDAKDPYVEIVSSQSPKKRPNAETDAGRAQVLETLDALAQVFVEDVARFRGTTPENVLAEFGQGGVLVGAHAKRVGMVNDIGSFDSLINELSSSGGSRAGLRPAASAGGGTTAHEKEHAMSEEKKPAAEAQKPAIDRAYLDAHHPELVTALKAEGAREATPTIATAERERILAIHALGWDENGAARATVRGFETVVLKAMAKPGQTKAEAALELLDAREAKDQRGKAGHLEALKGDEGKGAPAAAAGSETNDDAAALARRALAVHESMQPAATPSTN